MSEWENLSLVPVEIKKNKKIKGIKQTGEVGNMYMDHNKKECWEQAGNDT